mgnify:CR=1 FL=1
MPSYPAGTRAIASLPDPGSYRQWKNPDLYGTDGTGAGPGTAGDSADPGDLR